MLTRATVTRVTPTGAYVLAPRLAGPDLELGPAAVPVGLALSAGNRVLIAIIDDIDEDLAVIVRLP